MTRRHICYVTGTRADFGLMQSTLQLMNEHKDLRVSVVVTGMHLSADYGHTVDEVRESGLTVSMEIPVDLGQSSGETMARNIAIMLNGMVSAFEKDRPDIVLLLGDRGEMLAGALAAIHLNIPVAHIHGGERSGTVDEPVRHAISKLSHLHLVTSDDARSRLIKMGENPDHIFVTGAPGLDGLRELANVSRDELCAEVNFDTSRKIALLVYHPVLQEAESAGENTEKIIRPLLENAFQIMALAPNSDGGGDAVREVLNRYRDHPDVNFQTHLRRSKFISWMAHCDLMIGNSSSGIIEAATFGTPVINVGLRQNLRLRNKNVIDTMCDSDAIRLAMNMVLEHSRFPIHNVYGDGVAGKKITELLSYFPLNKDLLFKINTY